MNLDGTLHMQFRRKELIIWLFMSFISGANVFAQSNDTSIAFIPHLSWSLFKGVPTDDTVAARISTNMNVSVDHINIFTGKIYFKALAVMNPLQSWVRAEYANQYTLQHEQTHFKDYRN